MKFDNYFITLISVVQAMNWPVWIVAEYKLLKSYELGLISEKERKGILDPYIIRWQMRNTKQRVPKIDRRSRFKNLGERRNEKSNDFLIVLE